MKERPILFSGPMVRALLNGNKTQTRRVVKPKHIPDSHWMVETRGNRHELTHWDNDTAATSLIACPYGQPGDRLWVREAWRAIPAVDHLPPRELTPAHRIWYEADAPHQPGFGKLRPSMFMPRWASRITLEVTSVRVERLQAISEADARAEGAPGYEEGVDAPPSDPSDEWSYRASFQRLWACINGPGSLAANPWVWVVEFRRLP